MVGRAPILDDTHSNEGEVVEFVDRFITSEVGPSIRFQNQSLNDFGTFLTSSGASSYVYYIFAVRSSLKKPVIFLKRKFTDRMPNACNINILRLQ